MLVQVTESKKPHAKAANSKKQGRAEQRRSRRRLDEQHMETNQTKGRALKRGTRWQSPSQSSQKQEREDTIDKIRDVNMCVTSYSEMKSACMSINLCGTMCGTQSHGILWSCEEKQTQFTCRNIGENVDYSVRKNKIQEKNTMFSSQMYNLMFLM